MRLPQPCGPLSEGVVETLRARPQGLHAVPEPRAMGDVTYPLTDRDLQLALWVLYELHYRGFDDVDDPRAEWDPLLMVSRAALERTFEHAVRELVGATPQDAPALEDLGDTPAEQVTAALVRMTARSGPSEVAQFLHRRATRQEFCSYLAERAVHHLRESDPQSFVLPRIGGAAKVALAELQYDEYGGGRPDRLHQALFARGLASLDLPTDLASYVEQATGATLASVNLMSLFALNRRLRGAAMGHLAAFEATSSLPCDRILRGARRLRLPEEVADYYDEHVEADAVHEQLAIRGICAALVADEPELAPDVVFGATACLAVDGLAGQVLLDGWRARREDRAAG
ncbi:iron-containing redox enzyme family protein [Nocardioides daeguensis]|uniref:Iron-containing redox enzyme family protein n=1 Tax=Nocardioides daeguensis TaxID=908359 RepID=A0ABP6V9K9_9ACTN|nr:iron-containing redox enzyme family protein [Nocardioides daeguensis]MBV6726091.1 iron-containing redox enzyme family protein [Nocardioides daeguensis]MCR1771934.1 iron-containing redox enzyme family protein [Nocardioides daeguensis]